MNFEDDLPSNLFDNFNDHFKLVFSLTSMQDATGTCLHPELVGETLRLEFDFTFF